MRVARFVLRRVPPFSSSSQRRSSSAGLRISSGPAAPSPTSPRTSSVPSSWRSSPSGSQPGRRRRPMTRRATSRASRWPPSSRGQSMGSSIAPAGGRLSDSSGRPRMIPSSASAQLGWRDSPDGHPRLTVLLPGLRRRQHLGAEPAVFLGLGRPRFQRSRSCDPDRKRDQRPRAGRLRRGARAGDEQRRRIRVRLEGRGPLGDRKLLHASLPTAARSLQRWDQFLDHAPERPARSILIGSGGQNRAIWFEPARATQKWTPSLQALAG